MPLNTFTSGLKMCGERPDFCGPEDLSDAIVSLRTAFAQHNADGPLWLAPISDAGIRRLIKLAFYASFAMDEGRYSRFRMISSDVRPGNLWLAAAFDIPITDVESLRRLAPAASDTDGALLITECGESLHCKGSVIVADLDFGTMIGRPEIVGVGHSPSLIVRVDGPGRIRASESLYTLVLDAGRIRQVVDYWCVAQVQELWNALAAQMIDAIALVEGEKARTFFGGFHSMAQFIHRVWSSVLAAAVGARHGGAFVLLPTEGKPEEFDIHCKYPAQMALGDDVREFLHTCVKHAQLTEDDPTHREQAVHHWKWRRAAVFTKARIFAGLSSVDGCVVLDRSLKVVGFGGEIRIDDAKVAAAPRALRNAKTRALTPEKEVEQMGTRHRSAYRLAKAHAGVTVFVISQDGELRIFSSDEHDVFGFEGLHAWVHHYESQ